MLAASPVSSLLSTCLVERVKFKVSTVEIGIFTQIVRRGDVTAGSCVRFPNPRQHNARLNGRTTGKSGTLRTSSAIDFESIDNGEENRAVDKEGAVQIACACSMLW